MQFVEPPLIAISFIAMILGVILALIPIMPGVLIVWGIAMVTAWANGFNRITPLAAIVMTGIMLFNVSSDVWLPALGVKTKGLSCLSAIGSFVGGLVGTFAIPVPILGTLIGTVAGALIVEYVARRRRGEAIQAGKTAARLFVIGYALEVASVFAVFIVYVISIVTTG